MLMIFVPVAEALLNSPILGLPQGDVGTDGASEGGEGLKQDKEEDVKVLC